MRCQGLKKSFDQREIFGDLNFEVKAGEFLALLGPSGIGKTTLLRCLAGLDQFDGGEVDLNGERMCKLPANKRPIGLVFQEAALFPHMTVAENIAYGIGKELGVRKLGARQGADQRVTELLRLISMSRHRDAMPANLSAGEQQRVALARALAAEPEVVLLDEPFANLDANLRISLRIELKSILKKANQTAIFVTHDREEAMSVADRIAVMIDGEILQIGEPETLYLKPEDKRVALFLGYANYLDADGVAEIGGEMEVGDGEMFFRPESLVIAADDSSEHTVKRIEYFGHDLLVDVRTAGGRILHARMLGPDNQFAVGDKVALAVKEPCFILIS